MHVAADSAVRGVVSGNSFTALLFIFTKYQFSMRVEHCIPAVALPCAQVDSHGHASQELCSVHQRVQTNDG